MNYKRFYIVNIVIKEAYSDINDIKELFLEYVDKLGVNVDFQDFKNEIETLPKKYNKPEGIIYIAFCDGYPSGSVALRRLDSNRCEMKRLYVRDEFRKLGIGKMLSLKTIEYAKKIGYKYIMLDTLEKLKEACNLYKSLGFYEVNAYYDNPLKGVKYFCLDLFNLKGD